MVPAAILLPQLFLAFGWMRAGVAHAITGHWWSGEEMRNFLAVETDHSIGIYEPFLTYVVEPLPILTAVVVCVMEIAVGLLLALNIRPTAALLAGAFLNLHFVLAGVVNPSAFYLVIALVIMLWRLERTMSISTSRTVAKVAAGCAGAATLILLPFIATPTPDQVIEDPALVLIFLSLLFAGSTWWTYHRMAFDRV